MSYCCGPLDCCGPLYYDDSEEDEPFLPSISIAALTELASVMSFGTANNTNNLASNNEPVPPINPYQILQVRRDATSAEIRESYRRLALWHHPGRKRGELSAEEVERRQHVFHIVAACYETLLDHNSRQLYDVLQRQKCKGEVLIGGRPLSSAGQNSVFDDDGPSGSLFADCNPDVMVHVEDEDNNTPALLTLSRSEDSSEDGCNTQSNAYANDPLAPLYKARRNRPFSDPYDLFDQVFESHVYSRPTACPVEEDCCSPASSPRHIPRSAGWTGTTKTLKDGTIVSTTCRILHDRKLTRTEVISNDGDGGQKRAWITVAAESLEETTNDEEILVNHGCCFAGGCGQFFPG